MAHIVPAHVFTDGTPASAAGLASDLFVPGIPATSFAERNGLLDYGNLTARIGHGSYRLGSGALGGTVTSGSVWPFHRAVGDQPLPNRDRLPIPGAGIRFWAPWNCSARFAWTIVYRSNFAYNPGVPHTPPDFSLQLLVNGALQTPRMLIAPQYNNVAGINASFTTYKYTWNGHWNTAGGAFFTGKQAHTAGVGVYCAYPSGPEIFKFVHLRVFRATFSYLLLKK